MAFGYEYWIVYLPEFNCDSFLLFVHNPSGSTKLRDYSEGKERLLGQPMLENVHKATEWGRTRFEEKPHTVSGHDGESYWFSRIAEYNGRCLASAQGIDGPKKVADRPPARTVGMKNTGRAKRGSQRQLQDYVNLFPQELNQAVRAQLPEALRERSIRWLSPLANEDYREYQDNDFLEKLGFSTFGQQLARFWPKGGPCWDALGVIEARNDYDHPVALIVEAKSHVPEMRSQGCMASELSFEKIRKALDEAKQWCGAAAESDWTGPLYQSANRIAHLYFVRQRLGRPCFLINLYFVDDPYRPTSQAEWNQALDTAHRELGLSAAVCGIAEVFLTGKRTENATLRPIGEDPSESGNASGPAMTDLSLPAKNEIPSLAIPARYSFSAWRDRWQRLASFKGAHLPDPDHRIDQLLALWQEPVPGRWQRELGWDIDKWKESPYRRSDLESPHAGEHTMEREILIDRRKTVTLLGEPLLYGINAVPLVCDFSDHGRRANVETDLLLLSRNGVGYRLTLCEVKATADHPWFAAVELLRQMRLFLLSPAAQSLMAELGFLPAGNANIALTGLVVAPADYYSAKGKKGNALAHAHRLLHRMRQHYKLDVRLAVWNAERNSIHECSGA
jgi:hypothetical protein